MGTLPLHKVRILHTSDTHLGDPYGHPISETAFEATVRAAESFNADYMLIAGDVFDNARIKDSVINSFFNQISKLCIPVIILPGNHDLMDKHSLYKRELFSNAPSNLYVFSNNEGEIFSFPQIDFWGKAMNEHSPEFKPVSGMTQASNSKWFVGMAHGHFEEEAVESGRSSLIFPSDISSLRCHYLALGHWDVYTDVSQGSVPAFYSGAPAGIFKDKFSAITVDMDPANGVTHFLREFD